MRKPSVSIRKLAVLAAVTAAAAIAAPLGFELEPPRGAEHHARPVGRQHRRLRMDGAGRAPTRSRWRRTGSRARCRRTGPNFFRFDDRARYYISFDNTGDGVADIRYLFKFKTQGQEPELVPVRGPGHDGLQRSGPERDPALRPDPRRRTSTGKVKHAKMVADELPVAPPNIGPKTFPNYEQLRRRSRSGTWTAARRCSSGSATIRSSSISERRSTRSTCARAPATRARARTTSPATRPRRPCSRSRRGR